MAFGGGAGSLLACGVEMADVGLSKLLVNGAVGLYGTAVGLYHAKALYDKSAEAISHVKNLCRGYAVLVIGCG